MIKKLLLLGLSSLFYLSAMASHIAGGEITYECLGNNQYRFRLSIYRDCDGIAMSGSETINLSSTCGDNLTLNMVLTNPGGTEISQMCPEQNNNTTCNSGVFPGMQAYYYEGTITIQPCDTWTIFWSDCCRNDAVVNLSSPGSDDHYIEATLNSVTSACDNSPTFVNQPIPYVCLNQEVKYSFGVKDPDADSVAYQLISARDQFATALSYSGGYTFNDPIQGLTLDPVTGLVNFTPNALGNYVVVVLITQYNDQGQEVGRILRDIQFVVQNCTNDVPTATDGSIVNLSSNATQTGPYTFEICDGSSFSFEAVYGDINNIDTLTLSSNIIDVIPGASITFTGTNPITAHISGTINQAVGSSAVYFTNHVADDACPILGTQDYVYRINLIYSTHTIADTTICGNQTATLSTAGGNVFNWSVISGDPINVGVNFSCNPCANPVATPAITTTYEVVSDLTGGCTNRDTVTISVVPDFTNTLTFAVDSTLCALNIVDMQVTNVPADTYTYTWTNASLLNDATIANPRADLNPAGTYTFVYEVRNSNNCVKIDSATFTSVEVPIITINADTMLCQGDSSILIFNSRTTLTDDFNGGQVNPDLWSGVGGAQLNTDCGSVTGNALHFDTGTREARTNGFSTLAGGTISFSLLIGSDFSPCEDADFGEDVQLEYSIDGGNTWILITTYLADNFPNFTTITENIPAGAVGPNVMFRLIQPNNSGSGTDNWAIDNFSIEIGSDITGFTGGWYEGNTLIGTTDSLVVKPMTETTYTYRLTNGTCQIEDSLTIHVGPLYTLATIPDSSICGPSQVVLFSTPSLAGSYDYLWSPSTYLASATDSLAVSVPDESIQYVVTVTSEMGCIIIDTVNLQVGDLHLPTIFGDTTLCFGESTFLYVLPTIEETDDFDGASVNPNLWSSVGGAFMNTNCGSVSGNALHFDSAPRTATTVAFNTLGGANISFSLLIGTGFSPCEDADPGEDVLLQYSIDGGANWITIDTYLTTDFANFTTVNVSIPAGAQTASTMFRWNQPNNSGTGTDNWAIDNVTIETGGGNQVEYNWYLDDNLLVTNDTLNIINPLVPAYYVLEARDPNTGCFLRDSVRVGVGAVFNIAMTNDVLNCTPTPTNLVATPDIVNDYDFVWTPATALSTTTDSVVVATPTQTTNYIVTVTSSDGCVQTDSTLITVGQLQTPNILGDTAICLGESTTLFVIDPGSTPPDVFEWYEGAALLATDDSVALTPIINTEYYVIAREALTGCELRDTITVKVGAVFNLAVSSDVILCTPAPVNLEATPDIVNDYDFLWSPSTNLSSTTDSTVVASPTVTTNYIVEATSAEGCTRIDSVLITVGSLQMPTILGDTNLCLGESTALFVNPSGATPPDVYEWYEGTNLLVTGDTLSVTPLVETQYNLVAREVLTGCTLEDSVIVHVGANFNLSLTPDAILCSPTTISLEATPDLAGDYDFLWEPASGLSSTVDSVTQASINGNISYNVYAISADGCEKRDTVDVQLVTLVPPTINGTSPICVGDSTLLQPMASVNVTENFDSGIDPAFWAQNTGVLNTDCGSVSGNALHFDATNRVAETVDMNTLAGGTVSFFLLIGEGLSPCEEADPSDIVFFEYSNDGGVTWNPIDSYVGGSFGSFTQIIINIPAGAQTASTRFRWSQPNHSGVTFDNWALDNVQIQTGSVLVPGSYSSSWSTGGNIFSAADSVYVQPTTTTQYDYEFTDLASGCTTNSNFTVVVGQPFTLASTADFQMCIGNTSNITTTPTPAGNYTYSWTPTNGLGNPGSQSTAVATTTSQQYVVEVVSDNGCRNSDTVNVTIIPLPVITVTGDNAICMGDSSTLVATGATSYTWDNGATLNTTTEDTVIATPASTTTYTIQGTDGACSSSTTFTLTVNPLPTMSVTAPAPLTCLQPQAVLDATSSSNLTWNGPGLTNASDPVTVSTPGTYVVTATNPTTGCVDSTIVVVTSIPGPTAGFIANPTNGISPLQVVFTDTSSNVTNYYWYFGEDTLVNSNNANETNIYENEGTYTVTLIVEDAIGCTDTAKTVIYVTSPIPGCGKYTISIPNIITPNGDLINDLMLINHNITGSFGYTCSIYNRWGNLVYESNDVNKPWGGRAQNGDDCQDGVYFYKISFTCDQETTDYHGSIQVSR